MPSTNTLRHEYPEPIRSWPPTLRCNYAMLVPVRFPATARFDGHIDLVFHPAAAPFFRAVAAVMLKYLYLFAETAGGSAVCRPITGGSRTSLHAHGIAMDINPSKNRYQHSRGPIQWGRQTDMDPKMIAAIEAIRSKDGRKAIEWGGRWTNVKDPMHFEIDLMRASAESGLNTATVAGWGKYLTWSQQGGGGMAALQVIDLQKVLNLAGATPPLVEDDEYGPKTEAAFVKALEVGDISGLVTKRYHDAHHHETGKPV